MCPKVGVAYEDRACNRRDGVIDIDVSSWGKYTIFFVETEQQVFRRFRDPRDQDFSLISFDVDFHLER